MVRKCVPMVALLLTLSWVGLLSGLTAGTASAGPLYKWTDANGVVHFSDRPPPVAAPVKKPPTAVVVNPSDAPYNNEAEQRWHAALRQHGVQIRTITIKTPAPTHSKASGP